MNVKQILNNPRAVIVDTETTGFRGTDQILQIAVVDMSGAVLFNDLVCPVGVDAWPDAQKIHGIKPRDVRGRLSIVSCGVVSILNGKDLHAWNADFDSRMLTQSFRACDFPAPAFLRWNDLMKPYSNWHGGTGGKWQKLGDACLRHGVDTPFAHSALGDALATLELLRALAGDMN